MINVYNAMGPEFADQAKIVQASIDSQLKNSKALGMADKAIDSIFGSDGDIKTIDALRNAGIDVDRSLRDEDLDEYLENLKNDRDARRKLREKYAPNFEKPVVEETVAEPVKTSKDITSAADIKRRQDDRRNEH